MIKVLIFDDQKVVCDGLSILLNASDSIEVVGTTYDGSAAITKLEKIKVDLVLMDLKMPVWNGIQATRLMTDKYPDIVVLVLTTYDEDEWVFDAIKAGAKGYLLKDSPRDTIIAAIKGTIAGQTHIHPDIASKLFSFVKTGSAPESDFVCDLNEREKTILHLIEHGKTNAEIANSLSLAKGTVQNYVSTILSKLGVSDRTQAAAIAWRSGVAHMGPIEQLSE